MSWFQKIITGTKFLFGGWESALEYVLEILNKFLASGTAASRVAKGYKIAMTVLYYIKKFRTYCPDVWLTEYDATSNAVEKLAVIFADGKVEAEELTQATSALTAAYDAWRS